MRIIDCLQRSEEWDRWRCRPTASGFGSFITPARGDYSTQATAYAAMIVAKKLGVFTEPPPSFWMTRGVELEPSAKLAYTTMTGNQIQEVGFIIPDGTDAYGGSPDALVGDAGILEVKCPKPETVIAYHADGILPVQYKPQVQGLLLISQRPWLDFFVFHESLSPFLLRVEADEKYQLKIAECLLLLLGEIKEIESRVSRQQHQILPDGSQTDLKWTDGD